MIDRQKIKRLRESLGLTQRQAATRAGWTLPQWNAIEVGSRTKDPRISTLVIIAGVLGVAPGELITPKRRSDAATERRRARRNA